MFTVEQRRARLVARHRLAPSTRADDPVDVVRSVLALHGTDPASVYLQVFARSREPSAGALATAIYDDRRLIRMLGMRRTMFVVDRALAPIVQFSSSDAIAVKIRKGLVREIEQAGVVDGDVSAWLAGVEQSTVDALAERGEAMPADLVADEPRLATKLLMAQGKPYEAVTNITSRVLNGLSAEGKIMRGRPRGSWVSRQSAWSTTEAWLGAPLDEIDADSARVELLRRWLERFGPATITDLRWWTGWTAAQVNKALAPLAPVEVDLHGTPGVVLPSDVDSPLETVDEPAVALLPALDPTPMGWKERGWFLGDHQEPLFDRNGNIGPTIWLDGRIVGGWAQRKDGEIVTRLLEDVGTDVTAAVRAEAERLAVAIGEIRFTPSFRTPLEKELCG
ncbi:winged helix DNA-binding protein [Herbihabitans rhizosphaerae]|uniref:Winged helix DNA-binding protein n=1 Tax=Herbihabitans rhizosphaerae TaxID=1872711 RepID=A0A4Q7KR14_9PSEU|nr:winged helix DNA-binding domain-containing protein [Herbihabitans rhizosphaerae]RZS37782.1 winged helix DNA-binding protein [Herbihabitans rhizosphaerae]